MFIILLRISQLTASPKALFIRNVHSNIERDFYGMKPLRLTLLSTYPTIMAFHKIKLTLPHKLFF